MQNVPNIVHWYIIVVNLINPSHRSHSLNSVRRMIVRGWRTRVIDPVGSWDIRAEKPLSHPIRYVQMLLPAKHTTDWDPKRTPY